MQTINDRSTTLVSDNRDMNIYEEYTSYTFYRFDNWTVQITLQTPMIEGIVTLSMYLYREGMTTIAKKVDVQVQPHSSLFTYARGNNHPTTPNPT